MCEEWGASTTPLSAEDGWQSPVRGSKSGASPPPPRPPPLSFQGAVIDGPGVARLRHHSFPVQDEDNAAAQMQLPGPLGSHAWAGVQAGGTFFPVCWGQGRVNHCLVPEKHGIHRALGTSRSIVSDIPPFSLWGVRGTPRPSFR